MNDLIVLVLTAAFFVVAVAYVGLCDRIVGPDPESVADEAPPVVDASKAAS